MQPVQSSATFVQLAIPDPLPGWPSTVTIHSKTELDQFYAGNREAMNLDTTYEGDSFADAIAAYDEGYFKTGALVLGFFGEGDGSTTHSLEGVTSNGNTLTLHIQRKTPEVVITVLAQWAAIVEIPAAYAAQSAELQFSE